MRDLPPALERLVGTVGLWTMTLETVEPQQAATIASELDELGFAALWIPEAWGREAFTHAGLLLSATRHLTIATGIANIWARDGVAAANAARTLTAAYDQRFVLGLGVSHRPLVERMRGHEYASPLNAMSSFLDTMDAAPMHAAEGDTRYARVLAALGPKMLALAATKANGVHPYLVTPEHTALARAAVGDQFIGVEQAVVLGQTREEFLRRAHVYLEFYTGLDNYRQSWRRLGFTDDDFVRGGSTKLCDAMVVHGDEATIRAAVAEHRDAGADHVCLQVLGAASTSPPLDDWRRLALAFDDARDEAAQ